MAAGTRCPDDLVTRILVRGTFPRGTPRSAPVTSRADYVHVPDANARDEGGTLNVMKAIDDEINAGVDYQSWDGSSPLAYGCPFGGTISYTPSTTGSVLKLDHCAFFDGLQATGNGLIDDNAGTFALNVSFSGKGSSSTVHYVRDARNRTSVSGDNCTSARDLQKEGLGLKHGGGYCFRPAAGSRRRAGSRSGAAAPRRSTGWRRPGTPRSARWIQRRSSAGIGSSWSMVPDSITFSAARWASSVSWRSRRPR